MKEFASGAVLVGFWVASLFFLRFWSKTKDRFFGLFSLSFFMMGTERIALALINPAHEARSLVYLIRLAAFLVILAAVLDKNRPRSNLDS